MSFQRAGTDPGVLTIRLTCSGVRGFEGREPEWVARGGGVDGLSAMVEERVVETWLAYGDKQKTVYFMFLCVSYRTKGNQFAMYVRVEES
jgi:hypothetical protein